MAVNGRIYIAPTNGQAIKVTITRTSGGTTTFHSDAAQTSAVTFPDTITSGKTYYSTYDGQHTISCQIEGIEVAGGIGDTATVILDKLAIHSIRPRLEEPALTDDYGRFGLAGVAPTAAAGAGAGSSPPAPVVVSGSVDAAGKITWGTGTSANPGVQVAVTFSQAYAAAPKAVLLVPANSATSLLTPYVGTVAAGSFQIGSADPTDSQANTVYAAYYLVVE